MVNKLYYCEVGGNVPTTNTSENAEVPIGSVLMKEPQPTPYHTANEDGTWSLSEEMLKDQAIQQRGQLLELARNKINDLQIIIDMQSFDSSVDDTREKRLLTAWKQYLVKLYSIEQQQGFPDNIEWPTPPDEQAIE